MTTDEALRYLRCSISVTDVEKQHALNIIVARIEALEAALRASGWTDYITELRKLQDIIDNHADRVLDQAAHIEALEAALRIAKEYVCDIHALREINAALAPEPNNAG